MHWFVAALAVMVIAFGWATEAAARNTPARGSLLQLHGSIGLTILAVMIVRYPVALAASRAGAAA